MSILNSQFDIVSVDNPVAVAALAVVLPANAALVGNPVFSTSGTPTAGLIPPGTIVMMNGSGEAILGTTGDISTAPHTAKKMFFVTIDGNTDYSGAFTNKLTCLNGGFAMLTDQYNGTLSTFTPGTNVTVVSGKISVASAATQQLLGTVGPAGFDSVNLTVQVLVPQGGL